MKMEFNINLSDDFFQESEIEILKSTFSCETDDDLENALEKVILASLREYKEMFVGMGLPSRADDIQQFRLFLLISEFFENKIPSESEVSAMFQMTPSRSKSLIRSVMTKYKHQLKIQIEDTLKETIFNDKTPVKYPNDGNKCLIFIPSANVVEQLNGIIEQCTKADNYLDGIRKYPEGARMYYTSKSSYLRLCEKLGITFNWDTDLKE